MLGKKKKTVNISNKTAFI